VAVVVMMVEWRGMSQEGKCIEGGSDHGHSKKKKKMVLMMVMMMRRTEKTRRRNGQDL